MNRLIVPIAALVVAACATVAPPRADDGRQTRLRVESERLGEQVQRGTLTKLQAAERLDAMRLALFGPNRWDDAVAAHYRRIAAARDRGRMSQEEAQRSMRERLDEAARDWRATPRRGAPPGFTVFLLRLYGVPALE